LRIPGLSCPSLLTRASQRSYDVTYLKQQEEPVSAGVTKIDKRRETEMLLGHTQHPVVSQSVMSKLRFHILSVDHSGSAKEVSMVSDRTDRRFESRWGNGFILVYHRNAIYLLESCILVSTKSVHYAIISMHGFEYSDHSGRAV
jgi:hypothetical protein